MSRSTPVEDVLKEATLHGKHSSKVIQYGKTGGYDAAMKDFYSLPLSDIKKSSNGTMVGILPDGKIVNVRPYSKQGSPTLEIKLKDNKSIKIRYD